MNCIKCGRDVAEGQLFCTDCLEVMEKYPVKPGIAIQLPSHEENTVQRKPRVKRKAPLTLEEQLRRLRKRVKRLTIAWIITLLLLAATIYPTVRFFMDFTALLPGQNYTTIISTEGTES